MTTELRITDKAAARLKALMERRPDAAGIRLFTKAAGCSGLMYKVDYVEEAAPGDEIVEVAGVRLFVDRESLPYLAGARMDWKEDRFETGFVFDNPNAKSLCGCGESFMV